MIRMIKEYTIRSLPMDDDKSTVIALTNASEREFVKQRIIAEDRSWNAQIASYPDENSYENDDYLFIADMIQDIRQLHKKMHCPEFLGKWIDGHSEIPGIHLFFTCNQGTLFDPLGQETPHDELLNMGVEKKNEEGYHRVKVDYPWLRRYIIFLQKVFDDNEELSISFPQEHAFDSPQMVSREHLLKIADEMKTSEFALSEQLRFYAYGTIDNQEIPMPIICCQKDKAGVDLLGLGFPDMQGGISIPLKKSIFCTVGFAQFYAERRELISELFSSSLKMILAHEIAHVARGHWNMRSNEFQYSAQRNVAINCELNADWTAAYWLISELLYDTSDGHPDNRILAYTRERLIYLWSIRIFACYLALSWHVRGNERVWSPEKLASFIENPVLKHPIYEFRLYNLLGKIKELLDNMARTGERKEDYLYTADGQRIDSFLFQVVWKRVEEMIYSFEYAFASSWEDDTRSVQEKVVASLHIDAAEPEKAEKMPFYLCFMKQAQAELKQYDAIWPEVLEKLRQHGMYYVM